MFKFINLLELLHFLFDSDKLSKKAEAIVCALLEARSPRLSQIAEKMPGLPASNYKVIQRFIERVDLKSILLRFFQEEAEFVIADPTQMPRPHARRTRYVGPLSDGQTLGYWLMVLATPFRGRAIPFHFITYSSQTIGDEATSRNQEHFKAFAAIKPLLGERPLVLDREFSYLELLQALLSEKIHFVIRLKVGLPQISLLTAEGKPLKLTPPARGGTRIYRNIWYRGLAPSHLIGMWREGFQAPLWILTDLDPEKGLAIYLQRMKIEESFRDCKSLLGMSQLMNHKKTHLDQMLALTLLAYVVGLFLGEPLRDVSYGGLAPEEVTSQVLFQPDAHPHPTGKWTTYSGLFILLRQRLRVPPRTIQRMQKPITLAFRALLFGNVRTFV